MNDELKDFINQVTRACVTCTAISDKPISFSVRRPDEIVFNQQLLIDIMYFNSKPILHVADRGTRFSAARYLRKADAQTVWNTFVQSWSSLYIGYPESILTDQGSVFMSKEWNRMCLVSDIKVQSTGIEGHNSLNAGESLHASLRRFLRRLEMDHPDLKPDFALSIAVHVMNCTVNAEGLCPMLLVFGVTPSLPDVTRVMPSHVERATAIRNARAESAKVVAQQRVARALAARPPNATDSTIKAGDMAYVYRERPRKWIGPLPCIHRDGKKVVVAQDQTPKSFNLSQVKKADTDVPIHIRMFS